ncbi:MAG: hypothetical protein ACYS21_00865, partial [Planctomycetota bacterium]
GDAYINYLFGGTSNSQINLFDSGDALSGTDSALILGTDYDDLFLMRAAVAADGLAFVALLKHAKIETVIDGYTEGNEIQSLTVQPGGTMVLSLTDENINYGKEQRTNTIFLVEEGDGVNTATEINEALIEDALEEFEGITDVDVTAKSDGTGFLITFTGPGNQDIAELEVLEGVGHVERVNYTAALDSIEVFGLDGNDRFGIDDVRVDMKIYGGAGEDFFQVAQLYKAKRNAAAGVPNADVFATIETTRGYLSNGITSPLTIYGGDDDDEFVVYHNLSPLQLFGDDGDDTFLIRAFALVGSQEDLRERTDVSGDAGADMIMYAVNAPVNIDGGDGFDTVIIIGTEFNDDFVVTENGVYGAGLNVLFTRVESVEVDGAEGDDRFFILGAGSEQLNKVTGGLGSDTFFINGATPDVISNDLLGHSGLISHTVSSEGVLDSEYAGTKAVGISANVADDDEPAIRIIETDGSSVVSQALKAGLKDYDIYGIVLTRKPENGATVVVRAYAPQGVRFRTVDLYGTPIDVDADLDQQPEAIVLEFNDANWDTPQYVSFEADQQGSALLKTDTQGTPAANEVQVLSIGATGGSFTLAFASTPLTKTAEIPFVIDGDGVKSAADINAEAIEDAINHSVTGLGVTVSVTGSGTSYNIEFTSPALTGVDDLVVVDNNLIANDFEGVVPGFITHTVAVMDGAIGNGDIIEDLFVFEEVEVNSRFLQIAGGLPLFIADQGPDALRGATIKVTAGSGIGQVRLIVGNNITGEIEVSRGWLEGLDDTSRVEILRYSGVVLPALLVEVVGDDGPALDVRETGAGTFAVEATEVHQNGSGVIDQVSIALAQAPVTGDVTVSLSSDEISPALGEQLTFLDVDDSYAVIEELVFTDANWSTPRNIAIIGTDDPLVEGFHKPVFTMNASGDGTASVTTTRNGGGGDSEVQVLEIHANGGSFTLAFASAPSTKTAEINFDEDGDDMAQAIEDAINDPVTGLGVTVSVKASTSETKFFITFNDTTNHGPLTVVDNNLTATSRASVVVDVADDEVPGVLVLQSDGSTNVIEIGDGNFDGAGSTDGPPFYDADIGSFINSDTYQVVLTKAPKAGEIVTVNLIAEPTRTQRGGGLYGIRAFTPEVELWDLDSSPLDQKIEFTTANWYDPIGVGVTAVADDRVDGGDSKSFATQLDLANNIEGPLTITGGMTDDRSADLEREPLMLLGETNFKPEIGSVVEADSFTITIDIDEVVDGTASADTLTEGGSFGVLKVVTNTDGRTSPTPANEVQLLTVDAVSGKFGLWLDVNENKFPELAEIVWDINYDPDNLNTVAGDIKTGLTGLAGITVDDVLASDGAFLIKFGSPVNTDLPQLFAFPDIITGLPGPTYPVTRVGVFIDGPGGSSAGTVKQDLAIYGNDGEFVLDYNGTPTAPIPFDPEDEDQANTIKTKIQAAVNTSGHTGVTVEVNGSSSHYQVVFTNAPTPVSIPDLSLVSQSLIRNEVQTLAINASAGTFMLKYQNDSNATDPLAWNIDPGDLETAIEGLTYITQTGTAQAGTGTTITLGALSSTIHDYYNGSTIEITGGTGVEGESFEIIDYDGLTKVATIDGTWTTTPDATTTYKIEVPFKDVSVTVDIDTIRAERLYTITFLDPGNVGVDQLEVVENVSASDTYFTLERTVKEAIETKLLLTEALIAPEQLFDYTLEIVKNDAKNKVRLITDGTSELGVEGDTLGHTLFIFEVDRPWEGGLTREVPDSDSLFTLENTNPNLLVDENEETDILYLNDDDSVVSYYNDIDGDGDSDVELDAGKLRITNDRLTGLGMAPAPQYVGGDLVDPGVKYVGLEEMYIDLGTGDNVVEIMDTHQGATTINAGPGEDIFDIYAVTGHTYVNAGPDADTITVTDASLVEGVDALLTISGDVPQVQVITLGKGSPPDFAVNVEAADEIQQFTVEATGGSFSLGFTNPADLTDTEFTTALDWNASAEEVQSALEALAAIKQGDILVEKFGPIYRVSFMADLGARDIPLLSVNDLGLTTQGPIDTLYVDDSAETEDSLALLTSSSLTGLGMASVNEIQTLRIDATGGYFKIDYVGGAKVETITQGDKDNNEVQALTIKAEGGTFTLGYDNGGEVLLTGPITYDPTDATTLDTVASDIESGLNGLTGTPVTVSVSRSDSTFTITFDSPVNKNLKLLQVDASNLEDSTPDLAYNIDAATLQAELEDLGGIGVGNVRVDQNDDVYVIRFRGTLTNTQVDPLEAVNIDLVRTSEDPSLNNNDGEDIYDEAGGTSGITDGLIEISTRLDGLTAAAANEVQKLFISNATEGTFTLAFGDPENVTVDDFVLDYDFTVGDLQLSLESLENIAAGDVKVREVDTGNPDNREFTIEFIRELSSTDVPAIQVVNNWLNAEATLVEAADNYTFPEPPPAGVLNGYDTAINDVQVMTIDATAGTFKLALEIPQPNGTTLDIETVDLPYDASAEQVRKALQNAIAYAITEANATLQLAISSATTRSFRLAFNNDPTATVTTLVQGETGTDEQQLITIKAQGGTFTIGFEGETTDPVSYNAPDTGSGSVQEALESLSTIGAGNVSVAKVTVGGEIQYTVTFTGTLAATNVSNLVVDPSWLLPPDPYTTLQLSHNVTAEAIASALDGIGGIGTEYTIEVIAKGGGNFEIEFLGIPFYEDIPTMEVIEQDTDGSVIVYTQGVREAYKTDFTVTRVENTYTIGFQGKTRQLDAGPGVSLVVADTSDLTGTVNIVTRMDGVNYYGVETFDILLGSGSDIVSVQGTSQGSYDYDMDMTAVIETSTDGNGTDVPEVQRLRLNAAGTFTLSLGTSTSDPITVDPADLDSLASDIEDALDDI